MNYQKLLDVEKKLVSPKRYTHICNVVNAIQILSKLYYVDYTQATIAAVFHDWCKDWTTEELLLYIKNNHLNVERNMELVYHGNVSAHLIQEQFKYLCNNNIVEAINYHTTLINNPCQLTKVLFIADYIESGRIGKHYDVIRNMIGKFTLDEICVEIICQIQSYLVQTNKPISKNSIAYLLSRRIYENNCCI